MQVKCFISYYIGMFITKLISREIFNYDYLVHYGIVRNYKSIRKDKGYNNGEPDLIAFCRNKDKYSVFEAKGRQYVKNKMLISAKNQIKVIKTISGLRPNLGVVSVTHPIKEGCRLKCSLYDPEINNEEKVKVTKEELLYLYYYPIYELIRENLIDTSYCKFELALEEGVIMCSIKMDDEMFSYFSQGSDEISSKNKECVSRLSGIVENLSANREDVIIKAEWIAKTRH